MLGQPFRLGAYNLGELSGDHYYVATGGSFVNVMAVISYRQVLLAEGSEAALGQHVLWGYMLLTLAVFGPGRIAVDTWLERRSAARCRPMVPSAPASSHVA